MELKGENELFVFNVEEWIAFKVSGLLHSVCFHPNPNGKLYACASSGTGILLA